MTDEELLASLPKDMQRLLMFSKLEGDFTYLQMEVVTFTDLWDYAEEVVSFIERVWNTFEPFQTKLEASYSPRHAPHDKSAVRIFAIRPHYKRWAELRQQLLDGQVDGLVITDWDSTHSHILRFDTDLYLGVTFGEAWYQAQGHKRVEHPQYDPRGAKMIKLCINTRLWANAISPTIQEEIKQLAIDLFRAVKGACGYVHLGNHFSTLVDSTPYEGIHQLGGQGPPTWRCCTEVRGIFWLNLLSVRHVKLLGSMEYIVSQAPCYEVFPLNMHNGDERQLGLQLTPSINYVTQEAITQLEDFLKPILVSSRNRIGITILDPLLVNQIGPIERAKSYLSQFARRCVTLPTGALLVEYEGFDDWASIYDALMQVGCNEARGYRQIPQLKMTWRPDDAVIWIPSHLIPARPKGGPLFPHITVQACIEDDEIEFTVSFKTSLSEEAESKFAKLIDEWRLLHYEYQSNLTPISFCSDMYINDQMITWQANLAPVGQDAYIQLILMLDQFSMTTYRLNEVEIRGKPK